MAPVWIDMHVRACVDLESMRTTVEITDRQRAELLKMAAQRGEKGFSRLVQEAIELYLAEHEARRQRIKSAVAVLGTLDEECARRLEESVLQMRSRWR